MRWIVLLLALLWPVEGRATALLGVVYGTQSGQLRRIIAPDNDDDLKRVTYTGPGESMIIVSKGEDVIAAIAKAAGKTPTQPLAAVIDKTGKVISVIVADPLLDKVPDGELVQAFPGVKAGQTYDRKRGVFVAPAELQTIETTDADGNLISSAQVLVPAHDLVPMPLASMVPLAFDGLPDAIQAVTPK